MEYGKTLFDLNYKFISLCHDITIGYTFSVILNRKVYLFGILIMLSIFDK